MNHNTTVIPTPDTDAQARLQRGRPSALPSEQSSHELVATVAAAAAADGSALTAPLLSSSS